MGLHGANTVNGAWCLCRYVLLLYTLFGVSIIPLMYLFSFMFTTPSIAFVVIWLFNVVTGVTAMFAVSKMKLGNLVSCVNPANICLEKLVSFQDQGAILCLASFDTTVSFKHLVDELTCSGTTCCSFVQVTVMNLIPSTVALSNSMRHFFLFVPNYCFGQGIMDLYVICERALFDSLIAL